MEPSAGSALLRLRMDTGTTIFSGPPIGRPLLEEDAALIAGIRARDPRALERLYRRYHPRLSRFLANMLARPHLVEEVLNDTMMVAWTRIEAFEERSRLSTWLFGIAYRQALSALRRLDEPAEDDETQASEAASPEDMGSTAFAQAALLRAIGELSPAHRAVVNLTYYQELDYPEIAQILDCPVGTIKTRMFHARRHLKERLSGTLSDWL